MGSIAASLLLVLSVGGPIVAAMQIGLVEEKTDLLGEKERLLEDKETQRVRAVVGEKRAKLEADKALAAKQAAENAEQETRRTLYIADMKRIQQYWEIANIGVVRQLLNRYLPKPGEEDLRSFEWYYWWRQCHRAAMTFKHDGEVQCLGVSADGKLLASASVGGTVRVWDPESGRLLQTLQVADNELKSFSEFRALAIFEGGRTVAAASHCGWIKLWDIASRRETFSQRFGGQTMSAGR